MLSNLLSNCTNIMYAVFYGLAFLLTAILLGLLKGRLPQDLGRAFAVNGELSKGKARGAGLILICVLVFLSILFIPISSLEYPIYCFCLTAAMLTGFFDDAAKKPWNEYLKGALDLVIALALVFTFIHYNTPSMSLLLINRTIILPTWLFVILAVILVWVSINVVNCTDGVDGLCATLSVITFTGFILLMIESGINDPIIKMAAAFIMVLLAYLLFNCKPSTILMGDAGSRAIGLFLALIALKSDVLMFIPFAIVFILDGGLGLIKVSLLRFLKISIMKNIRTPLHDHFRKNKDWSDTQVVLRFAIIQAAIIIVIIALCTNQAVDLF